MGYNAALIGTGFLEHGVIVDDVVKDFSQAVHRLREQSRIAN